MSKRFTDTEKYKKPFIRSLQAPYKLLWDYLYHECDHCGIWIIDFEIAQIYLGKDAPVDKVDALGFFNSDELRIIEFCGGKKWFIPSFISFQYGDLNPSNRAHNSVIQTLKKHGLLEIVTKGLTSPLEGCKDKDKDKDKEQEKEVSLEEGGVGEEAREKKGNLSQAVKVVDFVDRVVLEFKTVYEEIRGQTYIITNKGQERSAAGKLIKIFKDELPLLNSEELLSELHNYFARCASINNSWLFENMSLAIAHSKITQIISIQRNGNKKPTGKTGPTDAELDDLIARKNRIQ